MLDLIKNIDYAWSNKSILYDIDPASCNGYFDFRNKVVVKYTKEFEEVV